MRGVGRERLLVPVVSEALDKAIPRALLLSIARAHVQSCDIVGPRTTSLAPAKAPSIATETHIVRELCPHSSRRDIPHEAFPVRSSTDKHNTLSSPCAVEQVDKSQRLDTLAVPVSFQRRDDIPSLQTHDLDQTVC